MSKAKWHPFPREKPDKEGFYLVTIKNNSTGTVTIDLNFWGVHSFWSQNGKTEPGFLSFNGFSILAWMELPEPYEPPEPEDMHPDAVAARAYTAGDPETVKRLTIFE
mgnify:CR=1 FL=1